MLKKLHNHWPQVLGCIILVVLLACIRAYESELFYDPFARYFESEYLNLRFPEFDFWKLVGSLSVRYLLNMIVSLAIIYVLFRDTQLIRFSAFLYFVFFMILLLGFIVIITLFDSEQNFFLFYIRRFLIQPLFLLLFVPAFFYQTRLLKK